MGKYSGSPQLSNTLNIGRHRSLSNNATPSAQSASVRASHLVFKGHHREHSTGLFQGSKVDTCSFIARRGNQVVAMPYYEPSQTVFAAGSTVTRSFPKSEFQEHFQKTQTVHLGMAKKPLQRYNPESMRSRLQQPDFKPYYVNRSVIELGNRTSGGMGKAWVSTSKNDFVTHKPGAEISQNHPGILANQHAWTHHVRQH